MPNVLITGGNRGIGLELVRQYLDAGWEVVASCRDPGSAEELQALQNGQLQVVALDVTNGESVQKLADDLNGSPLDVLINNAGIIGPVPIPDNIARQHFGSIEYDVWEQVIRTNTFGPIRLAEALLDNILAGEMKKIVTISSTVGSITERATAAFAYATSKTAVNKAMTLLASELRDKGVIVTLICPGYVRTRMDFGTADVETTDSAAGIRRLIDGFTLTDSGTFRRYNGETVAW